MAWRQSRAEDLIAPGGRDPPASPFPRTPKVDRDVPAQSKIRLQLSEMHPSAHGQKNFTFGWHSAGRTGSLPAYGKRTRHRAE
jgi:hypothetical protein